MSPSGDAAMPVTALPEFDLLLKASENKLRPVPAEDNF